MSTIRRLRARPEVAFFRAVWRASPPYAAAWWSLLVLRGCLPTTVTLAFGWLVSAVTRDVSLTGPLVMFGLSFTALVVLLPIHQVVSMNLGSHTAAHLYDRLMTAGVTPEGVGHLERPELTNDLTMARDFDQGIMGPPLSISMDFITSGLLDLVVGTVAALVLFGFAWWAPLPVVAAWIATHWLLRETGVWKDRNTDEVRTAQRHADYAYRLAVDAAPAKELRVFGLAGWVTERFVSTRRRLADLQYEATRLREKSVIWCVLITLGANAIVIWAIAAAAADGRLSTAELVVFAQALIGVSAIAFGGLNWALDGSSAPVAALVRLEVAMADAGRLRGDVNEARPDASSAPDRRAPHLRFDQVSFAYEASPERLVLDRFDLDVPAGTSMAIVGANGAGKTTLAKLVCRLYDPTGGSILVDGVPLTALGVDRWRSSLTAVFQDYVRFELSMRTNVAPAGAPDDVIRAALADAGASSLADGDLDTILSKGYANGTDLSGGQWQRIALARALCAVRTGASVVLLDEPTAQLDVRGEAEIFERVLRATSGCTVILISHRFSTVRHADRICVVEHGGVVELGSHDKLMAIGGRYRTMFDLQASRFTEDGSAAAPEFDEQGREIVHEAL